MLRCASPAGRRCDRRVRATSARAAARRRVAADRRSATRSDSGSATPHGRGRVGGAQQTRSWSALPGWHHRPMGKVFQEIDDKLAGWISRQHMFFVGTAPGGDGGSINVSPKGMAGTFAVLGPRRVAYLDYTGSGAETIAHLRDNGRIVLMFCAFEGPPKIVRLHGRGRAVLVGDPEFDELRSAFGKDRTLG